MILKASQRGGGQDLAVHLLRADENEHVKLHELRGFASENLRDAFREVEAISRGTKCRQYLFSVSFNPPDGTALSAEAFGEAIDRAESNLGLEGQPRAIVFHEKEGRRHAHCVWSRIDADTMTARHMSFFKTRLQTLSRELFLENGWKLPKGLSTAAERDPRNFTLAEWQQAKRQGIDPRWLKQTVQECWRGADGLRAFDSSLKQYGLFLAKGDRRSAVVLDHNGEPYSLPRLLDLKSRELAARIGDGSNLPSVTETKANIADMMRPAIMRHIAEAREDFQKRSSALGERKEAMTSAHRQAREGLSERQTAEWDRENLERAGRLPKGLRGLWHRLTGNYQKVATQNKEDATATLERHALARQQMIEAQVKERAELQVEFKELRSEQAESLSELRRDIGRYLKFSSDLTRDVQGRGVEMALGLER